jgi:hypothetical protein
MLATAHRGCEPAERRKQVSHAEAVAALLVPTSVFSGRGGDVEDAEVAGPFPASRAKQASASTKADAR